MRALITGGLGFIGSNLAHKLVSKGVDVTIIDALIPGLGGNEYNIAGIKEKIKLIKEDIRDQKVINEAVKNKDFIFHLAGVIDHNRSIKNPFEDVGIRINGTLSLLEACKKFNKTAKIIFISTRAVYGEIKKNPVDETFPINPKVMYAISCLAVEKMLKMYENLNGIKYTIIRLTNTYGPRHPMFSSYGLVNYFIRLAMQKTPITIYGDGSILRDFIYVEDASEALISAAENSKADNQTFNLGTGTGTSFMEMAKSVKKFICVEIKKKPFPNEMKLVESGSFVTDIGKIIKLIKWAPKTDLNTGIKKTIEFYKKNKEHYW